MKQKNIYKAFVIVFSLVLGNQASAKPGRLSKAAQETMKKLNGKKFTCGERLGLAGSPSRDDLSLKGGKFTWISYDENTGKKTVVKGTYEVISDEGKQVVFKTSKKKVFKEMIFDTEYISLYPNEDEYGKVNTYGYDIYRKLNEAIESGVENPDLPQSVDVCLLEE